MRAGAPAGAGFAPLSRFVRCADGGWARTHGNYPHHAAALARALAIEPEARALEAAAARVRALELEEAVVGAGGCAAAVRSADEWLAHPAGAAASREELVAWEQPGRAGVREGLPPLLDSARPAAGVRVLDLTRVIAGPVAGTTLAALGAEALRIDPRRRRSRASTSTPTRASAARCWTSRTRTGASRCSPAPTCCSRGTARGRSRASR